MKRIVTGLFMLALLGSLQVALADDATQQEKDEQAKERIYGIKHPWENTAPYGTQYTPPQAGVGSTSDDSSTEKKEDKTQAASTATKKKSAHKTKSKAKANSAASTSKKAPSAASGK